MKYSKFLKQLYYRFNTIIYLKLNDFYANFFFLFLGKCDKKRFA